MKLDKTFILSGKGILIAIILISVSIYGIAHFFGATEMPTGLTEKFFDRKLTDANFGDLFFVLGAMYIFFSK